VKKVLIILILVFICNRGYPDSIKDFQIEGVSLGSSLLNHFSEQEIKQQLSKTKSSYKNKDYIRTFFSINSPKIYKQIGVHFKNNSEYEVGSVNGSIIYYSNETQCYAKEKQVINSLKKNFENAKIKGKPGEKIRHPGDSSGKSTYTSTKFILNGGSITVSCTIWDEKIKKEKNWKSSLKVSLSTDEFINWLDNRAWK
jgi:hypothetical protein